MAGEAEERAKTLEKQLKQFLIVNVSFPSIALFQQRIQWTEDGLVLGYKISELLPRPFLNKLKNLYNAFLERLNDISLIFGVGEGLGIRVMPYDKLVEFEQLYKEFRDKLELLAENIISFIDNARVDPDFLKAYYARSVEDDYRAFWRKLDFLTRHIENPRERERIKKEIVEQIKTKARELPERFKFFVANASFDTSVILSNIKYRSKKEIQEKATKTLLDIFEQSRKAIEEAYREKLAETIKALIKSLREIPNEVIDLFIAKLRRFSVFDIVKEKIKELESMRGKASIVVVLKVIQDLRDTIVANKEQLLREEAKNVLESERKRIRRIIKKIEEVERALYMINESIKRELERNIMKLETVANVVNDEELLEAIDRLKQLDMKAVKTIAKKTEDPELQMIVENILSEELILE